MKVLPHSLKALGDFKEEPDHPRDEYCQKAMRILDGANDLFTGIGGGSI